MHFWDTAILTPPTPGNCEVTKIAIQKHLGISEWVYFRKPLHSFVRVDFSDTMVTPQILSMSTFPGCGLLVSHFETNGRFFPAIPRRAFPAVARAWPTSATGWLKLIPSCHTVRAYKPYKYQKGPQSESIQDHFFQRFDWGACCRFFGVNRSASNIGINETQQRFELAGWDGSKTRFRSQSYSSSLQRSW